MPRNSSGTYTLPAGNPVAPNTIIETAWANPTMSDIGSALTDSLDRFGRGSMLAPIKEIDGVFNAPAYSFAAESTLGVWRVSSGVLGVAVAGLTALSISATAATFNAAVHPVWAADPVSGNDLTRKSYVASFVAGLYLPLAGGTLTGPLLGTTATFSGDAQAPNFWVGTATTSAGTFGVKNSNGGAIITWGNTAAGAGRIDFYGLGQPQVTINPIASAVNYLAFRGGATGGRPLLSGAGSDANVGVQFLSQGTGDFLFTTGGGNQVEIVSTAGSTRFLTLTGSNGADPIISTNGGLVRFNAGIRSMAAGTPDVTLTGIQIFNDKLTWTDSTRAANAREAELLWAAGNFVGRFVNDAYSAANQWLLVTGTSGGGVETTFTTGAQVNTMKLGSNQFVNVNNTSSANADFQLQVQGLGQLSSIYTNAGAAGGTLYLRDTGSGGAGAGGALLFGGFNAATPFAAIKGSISDASGSTAGDLVFSVRTVAANAATTEIFRASATNNRLQDVSGNEYGYRRLPTASVATGAFVAADSGKVVHATAGVTVPNSTMATGDVVTIYNTTSGAITITATVSTLRLAGTTTTGNRTLAGFGIATIFFQSPTVAICGGPGVS